MININFKNISSYDISKLANALLAVDRTLIGEVITDATFIEKHLKEAGFDVEVTPAVQHNFFEEIDQKIAIDSSTQRYEVSLDETP